MKSELPQPEIIKPLQQLKKFPKGGMSLEEFILTCYGKDVFERIKTEELLVFHHPDFRNPEEVDEEDIEDVEIESDDITDSIAYFVNFSDYRIFSNSEVDVTVNLDKSLKDYPIPEIFA